MGSSLPELMEPVVQYGFAGLSVVLLGVVVWLVNKLLNVLESTNQVISQNTEVITEITKQNDRAIKMLNNIHDKLLSRPCIARKENG